MPSSGLVHNCALGGRWCNSGGRSQPVEAIALVKRALRSVRGLTRQHHFVPHAVPCRRGARRKGVLDRPGPGQGP